MIAGRRLAPSLAALLVVSCTGEPQQGNVEFDLPSELQEVSGLAVAGPDSVFTHDDEHAIIYEVSLANGHIVRAFALGKPTLEGDFEGIDAEDGRVFLITSDGLIYSAEPGRNGERVSYQVYDSGVGRHCEIEGLSHAPEQGRLLILCKRLRAERAAPRLDIFQWRIGAEQADAAPWLSLPLDALVEEGDRAEFGPSAIEWDPLARHLLVVSGRDRLLLVLDERGRLLERHRLSRTLHPKAEGIALMPDRRLVLADEGSSRRAGRIAAFAMPKPASDGSP